MSERLMLTVTTRFLKRKLTIILREKARIDKQEND